MNAGTLMNTSDAMRQSEQTQWVVCLFPGGGRMVIAQSRAGWLVCKWLCGPRDVHWISQCHPEGNRMRRVFLCATQVIQLAIGQAVWKIQSKSISHGCYNGQGRILYETKLIFLSPIRNIFLCLQHFDFIRGQKLVSRRRSESLRLRDINFCPKIENCTPMEELQKTWKFVVVP